MSKPAPFSLRCFNGLGPLIERPRYSLLHMADELTLLYQFRLEDEMFSHWNGRWSFRVHIARLWFGASIHAAFIIWNGPIHSWQIQTWEPHFAHWRSSV